MKVDAIEAACEIALYPLDVPVEIWRNAHGGVEVRRSHVFRGGRELFGVRQVRRDAAAQRICPPRVKRGGAGLGVGGGVGQVDLKVHRLVRAAVGAEGLDDLVELCVGLHDGDQRISPSGDPRRGGGGDGGAHELRRALWPRP